MNHAAKTALQGGIALAGMAGVRALERGAVKQYQERGMKETGSAFEQPGFNAILGQYTQQTGLSPEVTANTYPSGASYSRGGSNSISLNIGKASKFTLGHELGHQSIDAGGGPLQWIQNHTYGGINPNVMGLATVGVGAVVPSVRRAASLALGMNYLNNSGRIVSEVEASRRGTNLLNQAGYPVSTAPGAFQAAGYVIAPAAAALKMYLVASARVFALRAARAGVASRGLSRLRRVHVDPGCLGRPVARRTRSLARIQSGAGSGDSRARAFCATRLSSAWHQSSEYPWGRYAPGRLAGAS